RKNLGYRLDEVAHLVARRADVVGVAVEIVVGRAEHGHVLPRLEEDLPIVDRLRDDREVGDAPVEDHVDALAGTNARALRREARGARHDRAPRTRRVHDRARADLDARARRKVPRTNAARATAFVPQDRFDRRVGVDLGATLDRVDRIGHAEPRAIDAPL